MSNTYRLSGRTGGPIAQIARMAFLAAAAIGGLFMLVFSAAFALFAVAGVAIIGFVVFTFFWARAKILGKPFGPKAQMEQMRKDMESQMGGLQFRTQMPEDMDGPTIDAHKTPDGWSVDN